MATPIAKRSTRHAGKLRMRMHVSALRQNRKGEYLADVGFPVFPEFSSFRDAEKKKARRNRRAKPPKEDGWRSFKKSISIIEYTNVLVKE